MTPRKFILAGAIALAAAALGTGARAQYQSYPYGPPPPAPQAWSYDPYTSGLSACVQYRPGDPESCKNQRLPSYGQPSYGPAR